MKLQNLKESDSQNILNEMRAWCSENVIDYVNMYEAQDEELLKFFPDTNQIFINACEILTTDTQLPYEILVGEFFKINGLYLTSFKNTPNVRYRILPTMVFEHCDELDFTKVYYDTSELEIHFDSMTKISPTELNTRQQFKSLSFEFCNNKNIYDISKYKGLNVIEKLFILGGNYFIINLSDIFDTNIKRIGNIDSIIYANMKEQETLIDTLNKYLKLGKDHIMDMTLQLIDFGFEKNL